MSSIRRLDYTMDINTNTFIHIRVYTPGSFRYKSILEYISDDRIYEHRRVVRNTSFTYDSVNRDTNIKMASMLL